MQTKTDFNPFNLHPRRFVPLPIQDVLDADNDADDDGYPGEPEDLPAVRELQTLRQWVAWRRVERHGTISKVPYAARSTPWEIVDAPRASTTNPATWGRYVDAWFTRWFGNFDGTGFVFTEGDPYCGIDLDDAIDESGELAEWARVILDAVASYAEISPSSRGVKAVCRAKLPGGGKQVRVPAEWGGGKIEIYDQKRYFTITERHLAGTPVVIAESQAVVDALYEELSSWGGRVPGAAQQPHSSGRDAGPAPGTAPTPPAVGDEEVLRRCLSGRGRRKFASLWAGDYSLYGGDRSRADCGLCVLLARHTSDVLQIERLFGRSKLAVRDKWQQRDDYRKRTVNRALNYMASRPEAKPGRGREPSAYRHPGVQEGADEGHTDQRPVEGNEEPDVDAGRSDSPDGRAVHDDLTDAGDVEFVDTDLANVQRFVRLAGGDLLHCPALGGPLVFNGTNWAATGARRRELDVATSVAAEIVQDARRAAPHERSVKLMKWARESEGRPRISAMTHLARVKLAAEPTQFDADPWLLACPNGTLDLRTGRLKPHDPRDYITKVSPVAYDPAATCPAFDQFVNQIFRGKQDLIEYVERLLGWCLTGDVRHHVLPIFHGQGRNGKGTLVELMMYVMGGHACYAPNSLIGGRREEHPTELADLQGRRLAVLTEAEEGQDLRIQTIKRLTGDGWVKARRMRVDYFEFERTHKLILVTNNKPRIAEDTHAVWERVKLVPFDFIAAAPDTSLPAKLRAEAPGVLARLVRACQRWQSAGYDLAEPAVVRVQTAQYRREENPYAQFLEEMCEVTPGGRVSRRDLYAAYVHWTDRPDVSPDQTKKRLYKVARELPGVKDLKTSVGCATAQMFTGVQLRLPR